MLRKKLKANATVIKRTYRRELEFKTTRAWKKSPYSSKISAIDRRLMQRKGEIYLKMVKGMSRRRISILTQLRTGHAPLNNFLFKIGKSENQLCAHCKITPETVRHFLVECLEWKELHKPIQRIDSRRSQEIRHLLGSEKLLKETMKYIDRTGRFKDTHGEGENKTNEQ